MSLIKCNECGKELSDQAKNCPTCGCPIISKARQPENTVRQHSGLSVAALILSILGCTFIAGAIFALIDLCKKNSTKKHILSVASLFICGGWVVAAIYIGGIDKKTDNIKDTAPTTSVIAEIETTDTESSDTEVNDTEVNDSEVNDTEVNDTEPSDTKTTQKVAAKDNETTPVTTKEETTSSVDNDVDGNIPNEYKSALNKANTYSNFMPISKAALYDQLTSEYGEKFSPEAAQYAIDNVVVDWKTNALKKAENYSDLMSMSKMGIYDLLISEYGEKFTVEEAQYAIDNIDADWKENALIKAKMYQDSMNMSPESIRDLLISEYGEKFTQEEADYAIANLN